MNDRILEDRVSLGSAGRRGGVAAASLVALSTGSVAIGVAGATAQGSQGDAGTFLTISFGLVVLAVLPISAVTAAASAARNTVRALAHALLAGAVAGAVGGLAVHSFFTSEACPLALGPFVLGAGLGGALLAPVIVAAWAPSILAAITARRSPTHDGADAVQAITAGWAAVLLGALVLAVLALGGTSPWLLPIVVGALVDLAWWRSARARIDRRVQTLPDARGHGRATLRNLVTGPLRWFEVAVLVVLVVGSVSALVGWLWTDLLSDSSFRSCMGLR